MCPLKHSETQRQDASRDLSRHHVLHLEVVVESASRCWQNKVQLAEMEAFKSFLDSDLDGVGRNTGAASSLPSSLPSTISRATADARHHGTLGRWQDKPLELPQPPEQIVKVGPFLCSPDASELVVAGWMTSVGSPRRP